MTRKITLLFLIGFNTFCFSQSLKEEINILTEDIFRFWEAYDSAVPRIKASAFKDYLKHGTKGLENFASIIKSSKKLALAIRNNKENYEKIREASLNIERDERIKIEEAFHSLKTLYNNTVYPDIYFVIGNMTVGSSISNNGIIIGYETLSVMGNKSLLPLIMHEAIHFQQNYNPEKEKKLLGRCINEGAANLISEITLGQNRAFSHNNDEYAFANEEALWKQFQKDMKPNRLNNWLYNGKALGKGPKHMGYWIGYQIVKEYYLKSKDKKQAISEILNIKDFKGFLEESGYTDKFKTQFK